MEPKWFIYSYILFLHSTVDNCVGDEYHNSPVSTGQPENQFRSDYIKSIAPITDFEYSQVSKSLPKYFKRYKMEQLLTRGLTENQC